MDACKENGLTNKFMIRVMLYISSIASNCLCGEVNELTLTSFEITTNMGLTKYSGVVNAARKSGVECRDRIVAVADQLKRKHLVALHLFQEIYKLKGWLMLKL